MSNLDTIFKVPLSGGGLILPLWFAQVLSREFRVHWRGGWAWSAQAGLRWSPGPVNSFFSLTTDARQSTTPTGKFFLHITTLERAMHDVLTVVCTHTFRRKIVLTVGFKIFSFQKNHSLSIEILENESKKHKESTRLPNRGTFQSVFFSFCFFSVWIFYWGVQSQQDPGGTLRMNGVSEKERERPDWGGCSSIWQTFIFYRSFYILS